MNKTEYLQRLESALGALPKDDLMEILAEYREHFAAAIADGRAEDEVAKALGDPEQIARAYRAQSMIDTAATTRGLGPQARNLGHAFLAVLLLTPANLIFVLGPYLLLVGMLVAAWAAGLAAVVVGGAGLMQSLFQVQPMLSKLSAFTLCLAIALTGVTWFAFMAAVTRLCVKGTVSYLRWNLKVITRK